MLLILFPENRVRILQKTLLEHKQTIMIKKVNVYNDRTTYIGGGRFHVAMVSRGLRDSFGAFGVRS